MDPADLVVLVEERMPLVRSELSEDDAWERVVVETTRERDLGDGDAYAPNLAPVSDSAWDGVTPDALAAAWPREHHGYVALADARSMREAGGGDPTVVLVDLYASAEDEEEFGWAFGSSFRCLASELAGVEANLSIANMDFESSPTRSTPAASSAASARTESARRDVS